MRFAWFVLLAACSNITGPVENPVGGVRFDPGPREATALRDITACLEAQGIPVPVITDIRWYGVSGDRFIFRSGLASLTLQGLAQGRGITIALGAADVPGIERHELAHILTGEQDHRSAFWAACGLLNGIGTVLR